KNIALKNATFQFHQSFSNGNSQNIDLHNVNLPVDQVRNGISGKFSLSSDVDFEQRIKGGTNNVANSKATAAFDFLLAADLQPQTLKGTARLDVVKAQGNMSDFASVASVIECDLSLTE